MLQCYFTPRSISPFISCQLSTTSVRTHSSPSPPPPLPPPLLSFSAKSTPDSLSSPACALQCTHFQSCSGCTHEFDLHRPVIVEEAAQFFNSLGVSDFTFDSCKLWGWRCRAKLAVRGSSTSPMIGLYQEGTHNVVDIPDCKAHHPNINAAVQLLKRGITELNVEPYDEDQGTGDLRYVQMAVTTYSTSLPSSERYKNGKIQIALVWNSRSETSQNSDKLNALANFLWKNGGARSNTHLVHSVWANFQTSSNNVIFGNRWRHLLGERDFWEHVGGIDICLTPSSFGQANTQAFDSLLRKLQKYVPYGASVADLYAGAGVIGLSLAATRKCRFVKCVEVNKESKLSFEKTVERLPDRVDGSISWHHADTSKDPLTWIVGSDVVVVDPPRKGLDASLADTLRDIASLKRKVKSLSKRLFWMTSKAFKFSSPNILVHCHLNSKFSSPHLTDKKDEKRPWVLRAKEETVQIGSTALEPNHSLPQTLIYISCGWESFKEDCKMLLSSNAWHLAKAHGFNFFPGTQSIEVLAIFKRGQGVPQKKKKVLKKKKKPTVRVASSPHIR